MILSIGERAFLLSDDFWLTVLFPLQVLGGLKVEYMQGRRRPWRAGGGAVASWRGGTPSPKFWAVKKSFVRNLSAILGKFRVEIEILSTLGLLSDICSCLSKFCGKFSVSVGILQIPLPLTSFSASSVCHKK